MNAGRFYSQSTEITQATLRTQAGTNSANYSATTFLQSFATYSGTASHNAASKQYDSYISSMADKNQSPLSSDLYANLLNNKVTIEDARDSLAKFHEDLVKRIEEFMERIKQQLLGYTSSSRNSAILDLSTTNEPGSLWTVQNYQSVTETETEATSFSSTGSVVTKDGRNIDFNVTMEMSRSFTKTSENLSSSTQYILTDPLVIQLDDAPDTISDQKWMFDIDGDGTKEEINSLNEGNGFLALDKNGNGIIDDGNELFGTKSGNGFKDLSAYDEDGNGWIDEADSVYSKLKVWTKDKNGNDKLMDLKQADVGAIYLGSAETNFTHKNAETNDVNAVVRQTGLYLHESTGKAGTVQQIDFATA